ncbi:MAG: sensor histidine kinase [Parasphingorhabdus sp.]|uniref:sensor histidine kinase n=1 Tax=Parasphingorhabdus sp. TaxID=2709688 RepID=UPI0032979F32
MASAESQRPVLLQQAPGFHYYIVDHVDYRLDQSLALNVTDIIERSDDFTPITTPYLDVGLTSARVWLRFSATNSGDKADRWRIDIKRQYLKELDLFILREGKPVKLLSNRETQPFDQRHIPSRFLQADFDLGPSETAHFYVSYRSSSTTVLPIHFAKPDGSNNVHNREANIDWALNGALFAMIILSLLLIPVIGPRIGVSFAAYISAGMLYVANADGYTFQFFWPDDPWLNDPMNLVTILLMPAAALNFSRQLFLFAEIAPRMDRFLKIFISLMVAISLCTLLFYENRWYMVAAYSLVPIATMVQLLSGITAARSGRVGAYPYIIGATLVVTSFVYATIAHLVVGQFDMDQTLDYGHFVLFMECVAFAIAIMLRLQAVRKERDQALAAALSSAQEKLQLNQALMASQKEYGDAKRLSEQRLDQLSNVSHDIRQPLVSLRAAIRRIRGQNEDVTEQMNAAFDYLEDIAVKGWGGEGDESGNAGDRSDREKFSLHIVMDNVHEIFADQARQQGKVLRYRSCPVHVTSDPVALMRITSNLVSNAIQHGGNIILLAARQRADTIRLEVWDNGIGLSAGELDILSERHKKSSSSTGDGLGLSIVTEIAQQLGLEFEFHSRKHIGSAAFIYIPAGD